MVGMPYPNPTDPELQERMRFMDEQYQQHSLRPAPAAEGTEAVAADVSPVSSKPSVNTENEGVRLQSFKKHSADQSMSQQAAGKAMSAGKEYYEDLCMKAVNQCVGRVIRHRNDYAAIVLADARWCTGNTGAITPRNPQALAGPLRKLPQWIQGSLTVCTSFGNAYGQLHRFHRQMLTASINL